MMPQALDVVDRLCAHAFDEGLVGGVHPARELEVLPYQNAELYSLAVSPDQRESSTERTIADLVEDVGLVHSSAP